MITFILRGLLAILNGLLGAPLNAGEALLAVVQPGRFVCCYDNIIHRTGFCADAAAIAFLVHPEILIHLRDHIV